MSLACCCLRSEAAEGRRRSTVPGPEWLIDRRAGEDGGGEAPPHEPPGGKGHRRRATVVAAEWVIDRAAGEEEDSGGGGGETAPNEAPAGKGHRRRATVAAAPQVAEPRLARSGGMRRDWSFENLRQRTYDIFY
ncbi:unnamed protein product [Spirodela intermedia]|uniref:Uncharacterized protein n=1 Tax=Spirodela intermedia TaxID=51605 RepID=A0A7I8K8E4_SPIIN|nr:unnamed protein product [Spirodela intermedia]